MYRAIVLFLPAFLLLAGCASSPKASAVLPNGQLAYQLMAAPSETLQTQDYRIGPLDTVSVAVFQEPELSAEAIQVDAAGNITLPLIGSVAAAGRSASELAAVIADRLGARYLENPQVTVSVSGSVSQKVTVQGEVNQAGVYDIKGRTTLLEALALARGETRVAALQEVVVFRTVNGQRMGAVFDVRAIRSGQAEDPAIVGNDIVVVGYSQARAIWRDILQSAPILGLFRPY